MLQKVLEYTGFSMTKMGGHPESYGGTKLDSNAETKEESYRETRLESNAEIKEEVTEKES